MAWKHPYLRRRHLKPVAPVESSRRVTRGGISGAWHQLREETIAGWQGLQSASEALWRGLRWIYRFTATFVFAVLGAAILAWPIVTSPWPVVVTLKHFAAAPNCTAARAVGLAPARRGEPGYYRSHDADNDGIACEPWPRVPDLGTRNY